MLSADCFSLHLNHVTHGSALNFRNTHNHFSGKVVELFGMWRIFAFKRSRLTVVAASAYFGIEFDGAHEGDGKFPRRALDAAFGKDVDLFVTMRTFKVAHVLHD